MKSVILFKTKGKVETLVDINLRTDYGKLRNIVNRFNNKQKLPATQHDASGQRFGMGIPFVLALSPAMAGMNQ